MAEGFTPADDYENYYDDYDDLKGYGDGADLAPQIQAAKTNRS